ncbi:MAG: DUF2914 domain-containing protein [Desulfobacterales bacterium]
MLKKSLLVWLGVLFLSGVCFAQQESAKEQMKETTPAAAQEQPAKEQMKETPSVAAQEQPALVLEEIHICTAIENREPVGIGTVFPDNLDKIYCFTKITGAEGTTYVYHVWYFGNDEIARVKLPVKSKSWRTWSSKNLNMGLGKGHVDVVTESGDVLGRADFEIRAAEKAEGVEKTEKTGESEKAEGVEKTEKTVKPAKPIETPKQQ